MQYVFPVSQRLATVVSGLRGAQDSDCRPAPSPLSLSALSLALSALGWLSSPPSLVISYTHIFCAGTSFQNKLIKGVCKL